jgi:hypothetical protein
MGQAKQRGTYEERRAEAIRARGVKVDLLRRRASPKHTRLMAAVAAILAQTLPQPPTPTAPTEQHRPPAPLGMP